VITAPYASNDNLNAQDGVFTLFHPGSVAKYDEIRQLDRFKKPLDKILLKYAKPSIGMRHSTLLYHFTLPISEAQKLLRLLHQEHIDGAKLYPGFAGVQKAMKERGYL